jgi:hypothetical protein
MDNTMEMERKDMEMELAIIMDAEMKQTIIMDTEMELSIIRGMEHIMDMEMELIIITEKAKVIAKGKDRS